MSTAKIIMGLETEYGCTPSDDDYGLVRSQALLPDGLGGVNGGFLSNGARFYVDCGHPEYATPECSDPWSIVAAARAGDRIVGSAYEKLSEIGRKKYLVGLSSSSLVDDEYDDYEDDVFNGMVTWGSHESYSIAGSPWNEDEEDGLFKLIAPLKAHLASRMVVCGAGGWIYKKGLMIFAVAPRLTAFKTSETYDTLSEKGLLDRRSDRLHLICGESLSSDVALFVRFASTSLLLLAIQNGHGRDLAKSHHVRPIAAMKKWLIDPSVVSNGHSAFSMQRHLISFVEPLLGEPWMPEWAPEAWAIWKENVEIAENDASESAHRFDWALKKALFEKMEGGDAEKKEADANFGLLGVGTFAKLHSQGLLSHNLVVGDDEVASAVLTPPSIKGPPTRADARAAVISKLLKEGSTTRVNGSWHEVIKYGGAYGSTILKRFVFSHTWDDTVTEVEGR